MTSYALSSTDSVCIIGAGISGLTAAKALRDRGVRYDHFEMGSDLGGLWRYQNDNDRSAAYRSLHINSSRYNMEMADFPLPDDFPVFGHHSDVLQYFEDYADAFDLREPIRFGTAVRRVVPSDAGPEGTWDVTLDTGETRTYGAVLVATGHHWDPRRPDFPGTFDGTEMHAHHYREAADFDGKRVLVVGIGNSACDVTVDLCRVADVTLSTRSSAWVLPKYILGTPLDQWTNPTMERWVPVAIRRQLFKFLVWLTVGDQRDYGLRRPDHEIMEEHPTISQELLSQIGHGRVTVRPNVDRLDGDTVHFEDGTAAPFDAIIYATGYNVSFPFLSDDVFHVQDNRVALYRYIVPPDLPGLFFLGLIQPLGAIMPLVERQGKWVAGVLDGALDLPDAADMQSSIDAELSAIRERYTDSPRHTIQVDFWKYAKRLDAEIPDGPVATASAPPASTSSESTSSASAPASIS